MHSGPLAHLCGRRKFIRLNEHSSTIIRGSVYKMAIGISSKKGVGFIYWHVMKRFEQTPKILAVDIANALKINSSRVWLFDLKRYKL